MKKESLQAQLQDNPLVLLQIQSEDCSVCEALTPKLKALISGNFPLTTHLLVDAKEHRETCGQWMVFSVPTVLLFVDGREYMRWVRHFSLNEIQHSLSKIYPHLFET